MVNLGEAIQLSGKSVHVNSSQIEELKAIALQSDSLRARILAHPNSQSTVHEMLIVLHRDSLVLPHRHPLDKAESYLVLEGALRVATWESPHSARIDHDLTPYAPEDPGSFYWRHSKGLWHRPIALDEWAVYLEVYQGPFDKLIDVEFMVDFHDN
jgi:cupin fold WbuC family metalloprotein